MVKEELYIIVDGERKQLDLTSPSDITLNFVSNLFNDLSKINASYSYTFKLPRTANNVRVLEIADDVRANGKFTCIKNDAEYIYDGVSLFSNANLYISGVEEESISAVLTWDVNKGLQELNKRDMSLRELGNYLPEGEYDYVGDEASDYEKDKVVKVAGWENDRLTFNKMSEYNSTRPAFRSLHNAGVHPFFYAQATEGTHIDYNGSMGGIMDKILHFPPENSLWEENGYLNKNIPFIEANEEIEYNKSSYYTDNAELTSKIYFKTYAFPTPIVPVPYLMNIISMVFNINLDFSGDLYNNLCLPLVDNKVSDALARLNYIRILVVGDRSTDFMGYLRLYPLVVNNYTDINPLEYGIGAVTHEEGGHEWQSYTFTSFKSDYFETKLMITGNLTIEVPSPSGSHEKPAFYKGNYPKILLINESYKDKDIFVAGELPCTKISYRVVDGQNYTRLNFNFNPQDGNNVFLSEPMCKEWFAMRLVWGKDEEEYTQHGFGYIHEAYGDLQMYVVPSNYVFGCHVNLFKNLPDISCMDFIKSVCYALGGYPTQTNVNTINLTKYADIITRINAGEVNDWSKKVLKGLGENLDDLSFEPNDVTGLTLAQKNYYLMKNDKIDEFGNEEDNNKLEDAYQHGYEKIELASDMVEPSQTIFTYPFYGGILWEKGGYYMRKAYAQSDLWDKSIAIDCPKGGDRWTLVDDKETPVISDVYDLLCDCREMKPILGVVEPIRVPVAETTRDTTIDPTTGISYPVLTIHYTGAYSDYLSMRPWNCTTDMQRVNGHDLLQELFGNPCLVKEDMNLNVADLAGLDLEKPVFLEKYNSYFAIKNIEVSSSDGISKVELIRIPPEILDPAPRIATPDISADEPTGEIVGDDNGNNAGNGGDFIERDPWAEDEGTNNADNNLESDNEQEVE